MPYDAPPRLNPLDPTGLNAVIPLMAHPAVVECFNKYRPWRKFRIIAEQAGLDPSPAWRAVGLLKLGSTKRLTLAGSDQVLFRICQVPLLLELLHRIDHATGGGHLADFDAEEGILHDPDAKRRFIIRSQMVEAAESSIMEGAAITRAQALDMLRSAQAPRTSHEHMVANNFAGMQWVKRHIDRPLTPEMLLEIQGIMTHGAIDTPGASGRFRRPDEQIGVYRSGDNELIYQPPPAEALPERLARLCAFANEDHKGANFLHPVVKAIILHFMVGFEHPFVDGNGRTARAVFYWSALRSGYRVFEYLAISELIRKSPARYTRAYLDTEHDNNDLTYFVLYHLEIIQRSIAAMIEHLKRESERQQRSKKLIRAFKSLNLRQQLLLEHAVRHPGTHYTATGHAATNGVTENTARTDLKNLVKLRLMQTYKDKQAVHYVLMPNALDRLSRLMST